MGAGPNVPSSFREDEWWPQRPTARYNLFKVAALGGRCPNVAAWRGNVGLWPGTSSKFASPCRLAKLRVGFAPNLTKRQPARSARLVRPVAHVLVGARAADPNRSPSGTIR